MASVINHYSAGTSVVGIIMDEDGIVKSLPHAPYILRARFPVTVKLVDQNGKTWQSSFAGLDLP